MRLLGVAVFLSGAGGVLFETLWFRVAGLTLGNGFWSANIVLASFMAGLGVGNAIAARLGKRVRRPLRFYAFTELTVGLTGAAIVVLLPQASPVLGRVFTRLLAQSWLVNVVRLAVAFVVMAVPATAMGLTLPILTRALASDRRAYGRVLGHLYGWNTLGGVAGALGGELWLIGGLGQSGTAAVGGLLSLAAAALGRSLAPPVDGGHAEAGLAPVDEPRTAGSPRFLAAAFLSGATLLALEVAWFRFLQLFVFGTSFVFAAMLAVVLLGIGAGGVIAGRWMGRDPRGQRLAPLVALAAALAVAVTYAAFDPRVHGVAYSAANATAALPLFVRLMLPTSILSGVLFTMLGAAQRQMCGEAAETTGKLTLANTLGAAVGSLLTGFVLLPRIGMEKTLFAAMVSYGAVALLARTAPAPTRDGSYRRVGQIAAVALFALGAALFPFGSLRNRFVPQVLERYKFGNPELLEMREGLTETAMLLRTSYRGQPLYHRLMTNGHSMSATTYRGRRYMKLYVYWALAVNPAARHALLISYGVGSTAKALADSRQLQSIDVVDISREILELGPLAFPGTSPPLSDARVRVHVEDGRFFLQTTAERFDLITAEPPPPRGAGITNLYSRQYFQLVHDRLREGGVATYWLPVNQLWLSETKAIMRGFCDAFPDCTLWSGAGLQWMLAGTRDARGPVPEAQFSAQWRDPLVAPELADLGFEAPESLGATFLADAATLGEWTRGTRPLDDDHPGRILPEGPPDEDGDPTYRSWMSPRDLRPRFESSAFIRAIWPGELRRRTLRYFAPQVVFDDLCVWGHFNPLESLHGVLTLSSLRTLPLLLMGTEPAVQKIAVPMYLAGARDADLEFEMAARAMSERDYPEAAEHLASVRTGPRAVQAQLWRTLALALSGREAEARSCLGSVVGAGLSPGDAASAQWLARFLQRRPKPPEASSAGPGAAPIAGP